jgi:hypothetical protein
MDIATFAISIDCSNAAFEDSGEISRILRNLADRFENGDIPDELPIYDLNGNKVGKVLAT